MTKLIDKTAAYKALKHEAETHGLSFSAEAYDRAARIIDQMPAIEAEPVRHGHWMFLEQKSDYLWKCSNCKGNFDQRFSYCPNCGARMDEGADNG